MFAHVGRGQQLYGRGRGNRGFGRNSGDRGSLVSLTVEVHAQLATSLYPFTSIYYIHTVLHH